jgi:O-antigen ligase
MRLRFRLVTLVYLMLALLSVQRVDLSLRLPIGGTRYSELIAGGVLALIVVIASTRPRPIRANTRHDRMHVLLVLFLSVMLVSSVMSAFIGDYTLVYSAVRSPARVRPWVASFTAMFVWALGISAFYVIAILVRDWERLRRALSWWVIGATVCSAAGIYGAFASRLNLPLSNIFPIYPDPNQWGRIYGLAQEPRQLAIFLSSVLPFLILATLRRKFVMRPLFQRLCLILVGVAFLMTLSRSTVVLTVIIVGLLLTLPVFTRLRRFRLRRYLSTLIITGMVMVLIVQGLLSFFGRPGIGEIVYIQVRSLLDDSNNLSKLMQKVSYEVAWKTFLDHPILGVGIGNFPFHIDRYMPPIPSEPQWAWLDTSPQYYVIHGTSNNIYLDLLAETGVIGTAAFRALLACPALIAWRVLRRSTEDQTVLLGLLIGYLVLLMAQAFSSTFAFAYNWATMGLLHAAVCLSGQPATQAVVGERLYANRNRVSVRAAGHNTGV